MYMLYLVDAVIIINTINHHQHHHRSRVPRGRIASGGLCCDRHNNVLCYSICYCRYVLHSTAQYTAVVHQQHIIQMFIPSHPQSLEMR
jgi:hypothetical protein